MKKAEIKVQADKEKREEWQRGGKEWRRKEMYTTKKPVCKRKSFIIKGKLQTRNKNIHNVKRCPMYNYRYTYTSMNIKTDLLDYSIQVIHRKSAVSA